MRIFGFGKDRFGQAHGNQTPIFLKIGEPAAAQFAEETLHKLGAFVLQNSALAVHIVKKSVRMRYVKNRADRAALRTVRAEVQIFYPRLDYCSAAHYTRLKCDIEVTHMQPPAAELFARLADCRKLGMTEYVLFRFAQVVRA